MLTSSDRNVLFDQALAFVAGALTPLLPLLDTGKPVVILAISSLLGGVIALRAYRNTAFADNQSEKRAVSLAKASEFALPPFHLAAPAIRVSGPITGALPSISGAGYTSPTGS